MRLISPLDPGMGLESPHPYACLSYQRPQKVKDSSLHATGRGKKSSASYSPHSQDACAFVAMTALCEVMFTIFPDLFLIMPCRHTCPRVSVVGVREAQGERAGRRNENSNTVIQNKHEAYNMAPYSPPPLCANRLEQAVVCICSGQHFSGTVNACTSCATRAYYLVFRVRLCAATVGLRAMLYAMAPHSKGCDDETSRNEMMLLSHGSNRSVRDNSTTTSLPMRGPCV